MQKKEFNYLPYHPVVWLVGTSNEVFREIAKQFAFIGCKVAISACSKKQLASIVREIDSFGWKAYAFRCDISEEENIQKTYNAIFRKLGKIDVLVYNAGVKSSNTFLKTTMEKLDDVIDAHLEGPITCIKAVLPSMVKRKCGWIINILSNSAIKTFPNSSVCSITGAGMLAMAKVLREEVNRYNVKVVNILIGQVDNEIQPKEKRKKHLSKIVEARSIAEAVLAIFQMPKDVVVDEVILNPMIGKKKK